MRGVPPVHPEFMLEPKPALFSRGEAGDFFGDLAMRRIWRGIAPKKRGRGHKTSTKGKRYSLQATARLPSVRRLSIQPAIRSAGIGRPKK